jgi:glucosylglycerate phosphorylase
MIDSLSSHSSSDFQELPSLQESDFLQAPDYSRPFFELPDDTRQRMLGRLTFLYGDEQACKWLPELERILKVHHAHKTDNILALEANCVHADRFTERDLILITYGDLVQCEAHSPLAGVGRILEKSQLRGIFNTVHLLPFFPYSSDKGFSVLDFESVDPNLGSWHDIEAIGRKYRMMFDGVLNHISSKSHAFQEFLNGNPDYINSVIAYDSPHALTPEQRRILTRPRTSDILTPFESIRGTVYVWTTFSADQIDLNYKNPAVLLYIIETLLLYVRHGADILRLDAVTYLWDEPGTPSVHLKQTHEIIKLLRDVMDAVAPTVTLLTETNVPHKDNVSYFGNGNDEAHMVYNFALPPLVLHSFYQENATALSEWAAKLDYGSPATTYLNILDTHDGIGLMGARNILSDADIRALVNKAKAHGALVSYRTKEGGSDEPYEINSTWFSALNFDGSDEEVSFQVKRFVASRCIALVLRGVPAVYLHGLIGTTNDIEGVLRTRSKRDINRKVVNEKEVFQALQDPNSRFFHIIQQFIRAAEIRIMQPAFHPNGAQQIFQFNPQLFSVLRTSPDGASNVLTITNVANKECKFSISLEEIGVRGDHWYDLVGRRGWRASKGKLTLTMQAYDVLWLAPFKELERYIESG